MGKLNEKVAVITGAGSGMGRASAILFSKEGASVVVVDLNEQAAKETCEIIKKNNGVAHYEICDISKKDNVNTLIEKIISIFGKIDILFNNAGLPMAFVPTEEVEEDFVDKILDVNVKGVYWGIQSVIPYMKKQKSGVIINTASINGVRPRAGNSIYSASKAAVINLTKSLAMELAPEGIRVVGINPVATETNMLKDFIGNQDFNLGKEKFIESIPLGRVAKPEDIANAALFLASDDANMVTGSFLNIDGGRGI